MESNRIAVATVVAGAVLALAAAACSGSSTDGSTGGTGTSGGSGASGGNGTSGGTGASGGSGAFKNCGTDSTKSTCTDAELATYSTCINDKCGAKYTECYGADYKNGKFSGPCGTYVGCVNACGCDDTTCRQNCGTPDAACTTCSQSIGTCSVECKAPACLTAGSSSSSGGAGSHSCADLKTCCDKIADAEKKGTCDQTYNAVKSSESSCNAMYSTFASSCP